MPPAGFVTATAYPATGSTTIITTQQPTYGTVPVVVNRPADVIVVGGCPACRVSLQAIYLLKRSFDFVSSDIWTLLISSFDKKICPFLWFLWCCRSQVCYSISRDEALPLPQLVLVYWEFIVFHFDCEQIILHFVLSYLRNEGWSLFSIFTVAFNIYKVKWEI